MKRILVLPAMIILLSLAACGNDVHQEEKIKQRADTQSSVVESKVNVLVENKFGKIEDENVLAESAAEKSHILLIGMSVCPAPMRKRQKVHIRHSLKR